MLKPEPVCPRCHADQEETRAALMAMPPPPPARWPRKAPPPLPLNAWQDVPCPTCHVRVPAGAPSCAYCGHAMLTDLPQWRSDAEDARRYAVVAVVFTGLSVLSLVAGLANSAFLSLASLFMLVGILCAFFAHGENPLGWSTTFFLGAIVSVGLLVMAATIAIGMAAAMH